MNAGFFRFCLLASLAVIFGCARYRPEPLNHVQTLNSIQHKRLQPDDGGDAVEAETKDGQTLSLTRASDWLRRHGPRIQEALAEYRTALASAGIRTPPPNPFLEIGPQMGFGPGVGSAQRFAPFGSIGIAIPVGGRLRRQDELNRAQAEVARIAVLARFREEYLSLRERYAALAVARGKADVCRIAVEGAEKTLDVGRRLLHAGQAGALDTALFEMEYLRAQAEFLATEKEIVEAESELAELLGVHPKRLSGVSERELPAELPQPPVMEELCRRMIDEHPELGRLRAQYEAAERALRLEIARQYPDIQIGPSLEKETGGKSAVLGLTLGLELPLFDRNQQGIAEAQKLREEVRAKYEAALKRALSQLERTERILEKAVSTRRLHEEKMLPLAAANLVLAQRSLEAGAADALKLMDAERSERDVRLATLAAVLAERTAWIDLERAVGAPLLAFPSELKKRAEFSDSPLGSEGGSWPRAVVVNPEGKEDGK